MPISTPSQITVPFATSGLKNAIPSTSNPVTGNAGYDAGFPATNMTPKEAGGIPPFGQDFNGILFDITTAIRYLEAGMQFPYSSAFSTAVGGYPLGAIVTRTDGTGFWRNNVANNTTDPETFGAGWSPEGSGISTVAMSSSNVTLTALQAARQIIIITGTLTANLNLVFPTYQRQWLIANRCTGAFSVTAKTSAGSGVSIDTGSSQSVYGDGTNISATSAVGRLIGIQSITSSGFYTPTAGTQSIIIEAVGGGGGSGGSAAAAAGNVASASGGGSAAYAKARFTSGFSGLLVTIGAAGAAGSAGASNGGAGTATSFGALLTCPGGKGGVGGAQVSVNGGTPGSGPSDPPTGSNIVGFAGMSSMNSSYIPTSIFAPSSGGSNPLGIGGVFVGISSPRAISGSGFGSGGSGSYSAAGTAASPGVAGQPGIAIIYEYA